MRLSEFGEFNLIKRLRASFAGASPYIIKGIGDDAAAIKSRDKITLVTSDMLLQDVHFDLSFITFYQLGYKILAVNISDIFAMGGIPKYFLIDIGIPGHYSLRDIDELYSGIKELAKRFKINVIGGDTCASKHGVLLSGTLIGETKRIIMRSGAKLGDGIFITNTLGDSAMGLMLLKKMRTKNWKLRTPQFPVPSSQLKLIKRHLMPEPRALKNTEGITSMIDISDGLLIDLSHICDESDVGARIYMDKIPLSKGLVETAKKLRMNPLSFALRGGEDYTLLFTAPLNIKTKAFKIGEIIPKGRYLIDASGRKKTFRPEGYEHFAHLKPF